MHIDRCTTCCLANIAHYAGALIRSALAISYIPNAPSDSAITFTETDDVVDSLEWNEQN